MTEHNELNRQLVDSLEKSLDEFDNETLQELANRRQQVLNKRRRLRQPLWAATAAGIAVLAALPWFFSGNESTVGPTASSLSAEVYSVDPEMLEVMDMLIALGELAEEDPDAI